MRFYTTGRAALGYHPYSGGTEGTCSLYREAVLYQHGRSGAALGA